MNNAYLVYIAVKARKVYIVQTVNVVRTGRIVYIALNVHHVHIV